MAVLLTAYDWLPEREGLADWITRRLEGEHPFLKARVGTVSAARALVDTGAISVLLDGVDEMPEEARTTVLRQIGRQATHRIVLSCRTSELKSAVACGHLDGAAALELAAITAQQAADYLEALDTPLMLSLLLGTYGPEDSVSELTEVERFPSRQQIEDHLLARVVPAAYMRSDIPAPPCTPQQAWQWLGYLAAQMNQDGTRDLAWWRIPQWLPSRHLRISIGRAAGLINGLLSGLALSGDFASTPTSADHLRGSPSDCG